MNYAFVFERCELSVKLEWMARLVWYLDSSSRYWGMRVLYLPLNIAQVILHFMKNCLNACSEMSDFSYFKNRRKHDFYNSKTWWGEYRVIFNNWWWRLVPGCSFSLQFTKLMLIIFFLSHQGIAVCVQLEGILYQFMPACWLISIMLAFWNTPL